MTVYLICWIRYNGSWIDSNSIGVFTPGQLKFPDVDAVAKKVIVCGVVELLIRLKLGMLVPPDKTFNPVTLVGTMVALQEINAFCVEDDKII